MTLVRKVGATSLTLALVLVSAACGDDDDTASTTTSAGATTTAAGATTTTSPAGTGDGCTEERIGGSITVATLSPTPGLDPLTTLGTASVGGDEMTAIYDTLMRFVPETGTYEPHVAESLEANDDATEWTLTLRDDVTFPNGDPLDAEVVVFNVERMQESRTNSGSLAREIATVEAVDEHTVSFTMAEPWGTFSYYLAEEGGMMVNPAVLAGMTQEQFNAGPPVDAGVGPYNVERFAAGEEIVLVAKDDYWGGPVCIEQLRFVNISGARAVYEAFQQGEVQMANFDDAIVIADALEDGVEHFSQVGGSNPFLIMNNGRGGATPPTADPRVRRAIAHAIDYEVLNQRVYNGLAHATSALVPEVVPIYPGVEGPQYDPDLARSLVEEAKADGWDGTISLLTNNVPSSVETSITLEAMLETVGFTVDVENVPPTDIFTRVVTEGSFDLATWGMFILEAIPLVNMSQWYSDNPASRSGFADPAMDAALDELKAAGSREEIRDAMGVLQEVWNETIPSAGLFATEWFWAVDPTIRGIIETRDVIPMFHDAYIEE